MDLRVNAHVTKDDMILEFLRAEVDSPRFGPSVAYAIATLGSGSTREHLIDNGDTTNAEQNIMRSTILRSYRGYPDEDLFRGFPLDTTWVQCSLQLEDLKVVQYAKIAEWMQLSQDTRLVGVAAQVVALDRVESISNRYGLSEQSANKLRETARNVRSVAHDYRQGKRYPKLIGVRVGTGIVLLEGHTRATGFVLSGLVRSIELYLGSSDAMNRWAWLTDVIW